MSSIELSLTYFLCIAIVFTECGMHEDESATIGTEKSYSRSKEYDDDEIQDRSIIVIVPELTATVTNGQTTSGFTVDSSSTENSQVHGSKPVQSIVPTDTVRDVIEHFVSSTQSSSMLSATNKTTMSSTPPAETSTSARLSSTPYHTDITVEGSGSIEPVNVDINSVFETPNQDASNEVGDDGINVQYPNGHIISKESRMSTVNDGYQQYETTNGVTKHNMDADKKGKATCNPHESIGYHRSREDERNPIVKLLTISAVTVGICLFVMLVNVLQLALLTRFYVQNYRNPAQKPSMSDVFIPTIIVSKETVESVEHTLVDMETGSNNTAEHVTEVKHDVPDNTETHVDKTGKEELAHDDKEILKEGDNAETALVSETTADINSSMTTNTNNCLETSDDMPPPPSPISDPQTDMISEIVKAADFADNKATAETSDIPQTAVKAVIKTPDIELSFPGLAEMKCEERSIEKQMAEKVNIQEENDALIETKLTEKPLEISHL